MKLVFTSVCYLLLSHAPLLALAAPSHEFEGIEKLDLKIAAGSVKVTGIDGSLSTLNIVKKRYDERCRLVVEKRSQTLFVELKPKGLYEAKCEADFDFQLPKTVSLLLKNESGDIRVTGMTHAPEPTRKPQTARK